MISYDVASSKRLRNPMKIDALLEYRNRVIGKCLHLTRTATSEHEREHYLAVERDVRIRIKNTNVLDKQQIQEANSYLDQVWSDLAKVGQDV